MNRLSRLRPSPALVVALAALVAAMSGAAIALPGKNTVKKNDIAPGAVTGKKIAESAIKSKHIKGRSIKGNRLKDKAIKAKQIADKAVGAKQIDDETITSAQVAADGLNSTDIADYKALPQTRVAATDGDASAAPRQVLFKKGALTVYGKCYRTADVVHAELLIETSAAGSILDTSGGDDFPGGPTAAEFLNPNTAESDRTLAVASAAVDTADFDEGGDDAWRAMAPDGTSLTGLPSVAAKNGNLAEGNGIYGGGHVCLFGGTIAG